MRLSTRNVTGEAVAAALGRAFSGPSEGGYVQNPRQNLIPGNSLEDFEADLSAGAGQELLGKFLAIHSSSALAANTFGPFKRTPDRLRFPGLASASSIQFEMALPTGLRGTAPHLDVVIRSEREFFAIESKLSEYFAPKAAHYSDAYNPEALPGIEPCWWDVIERSKHAGERRLDVAQLAKHHFGINRAVSASQQEGAPRTAATLAYLFWEPLNAADIDVCRRHRDEIAELSEAVKSSTTRFVSMSYLELWGEWLRVPELAEHAGHLLRRYGVSI